jgi:hypothetical protein
LKGDFHKDGRGSGLLLSSVFLEVLLNGLCLVGREIGAHTHVEHDRLPLRFRSLGGVALGMATTAVRLVQFRPTELLFLRFLLGFFLWFGRRFRLGVGPLKSCGQEPETSCYDKSDGSGSPQPSDGGSMAFHCFP